MMLENAYYSVISPEGCAAILWKHRKHAPEAAEALKLNATELLKLGVIDGVIPEPLGGAHRDAVETGKNLKEAIVGALRELERVSADKLVQRRYEKFRKMGRFQE
jgi:acetyl-CoA carboxylase carboxyl transferase subunit alpha